MVYKLTDEQIAIVNTVHNGEKEIKINAYAGSGKTSTLVSIVEEIRKKDKDCKILYLVFNKSMVSDSRQKFDSLDLDVECQTIHGWALKRFSLLSKDEITIMPSIDYSDYMKVKSRQNKYKYSKYKNIVEMFNEYGLTFDNLSTFCFNMKNGYKGQSKYNLEKLGIRSYEVEFFEELYKYFIDNNKYLHSTYLKEYAGNTADKVKGYKYLLVDEFQDLNVWGMNIIKKIAYEKLYVVGDIFQCLPSGTKINTLSGYKNIEDINIGDKVLSYSCHHKSDYFSVTNKKEKLINEEIVKITLKSGNILKSTKEHVHFADFYIGKTEQKHIVYLMYNRNYGYKIGLTRVYSQITTVSSLGFDARIRQENGEKLWILKQCETEQEARYFEEFLSLKYQIPKICFNCDRMNNGLSEEQVLDLYANISNYSQINKIFNDFKINKNYPHVEKYAKNNFNTIFKTSICESRHWKNKPYSKCEIYVNSEKQDIEPFREIFENNGKLETNNGKTYRFSKHSNDFYVIENIWNKICNDDRINIEIKRIDVIGATFGSTKKMRARRADSLCVGMCMILENMQLDTIEKIEYENYEGKVYDIDIDKVHNYSANGIITHNCIYSFNRCINGFEKIEGKSYPLSTSFRFNDSICKLANDILDVNFKEFKYGSIRNFHNKTEIENKKEKAILFRKNASLFEYAVNLINNADNIRVKFIDVVNGNKVGDFDSVFSEMLYFYDKLLESSKCECLDEFRAKFRIVPNKIVNEYVKIAEKEGLPLYRYLYQNKQVLSLDMLRLFNFYLLNERNIVEVLEKVRNSEECENPDKTYTLLTAHSSKGLEFDHVKIADDAWKMNTNDEKSLCYVAVTRAKYRCDCEPILRLLEEKYATR